MNRRAGLLIVGMVAALSAGVASQGVQSTALPAPTPREPAWAFPVQGGSLPDEGDAPKTIPGSTKKYTSKEIDNLMAPPDWLPDQHPANAPEIVLKGRPGVLACGGCHLQSGLGHPESADISGYSADYLTQQMMDFRNNERIDFAARMNAFAKALSEEEIKATSEYFASLPRKNFNRVVEAAMVPKTFVGQGRMRFVDPKTKGEMEPIGNRIITLPEDENLARLRDPRSGFVSYVPPGSIARGKALAETGGGKTVACNICHGEGLKGTGAAPRLANVHPIYLVRQFYHFKEGTRKGAGGALMAPVVEQLTEADFIDLAAYAASLPIE